MRAPSFAGSFAASFLLRGVVCAVVSGVALSSSSCASVLAGLALGSERGRADLIVKRDDASGVVYLERKPRSGKKPVDTVVMLHGFSGNKDHWTRLCAEMPDELWLIAPNLPGNGDSDVDMTASYDTRSQASRLHGFLSSIGVEHPHIVGNSLGGELAAVYGLAYPGDVKSLVLLDPAGIDEKTEHAFIIKTPADFDHLLDVAFAHRPWIPDVLKDYFAEEAVKGAPLSQKLWDDAHKDRAHLAAELPKLVPPTLVAWGAVDKMIDPAAAQEWRDALPGHLVVMLPDTGHGPMVERPAETAELMLVWWSREHLLNVPKPAPATVPVLSRAP